MRRPHFPSLYPDAVQPEVLFRLRLRRAWAKLDYSKDPPPIRDRLQMMAGGRRDKENLAVPPMHEFCLKSFLDPLRKAFNRHLRHNDSVSVRIVFLPPRLEATEYTDH